jgi:hypothetical protein
MAAAMVVGAAPVTAAAAPAPGGGLGPAAYTINVYPSAGMDETKLARLVALELDRRERGRAAAQRSSYRNDRD